VFKVSYTTLIIGNADKIHNLKDDIIKILKGLDPNVSVEMTSYKNILLIKSKLRLSDVFNQLYKNRDHLSISRVIPLVLWGELTLDEVGMKLIEIYGNILSSATSFAVRCNRKGGKFPSSKDVERRIGHIIQEATNAKVDLENPQYIIAIEIIDSYIGAIMIPASLYKKFKFIT
jgi:tRNA(Ser,Leu) C12 N-acetylase TAN1